MCVLVTIFCVSLLSNSSISSSSHSNIASFSLSCSVSNIEWLFRCLLQLVKLGRKRAQSALKLLYRSLQYIQTIYKGHNKMTVISVTG